LVIIQKGVVLWIKKRNTKKPTIAYGMDDQKNENKKHSKKKSPKDYTKAVTLSYGEVNPS
jgi:hypothetical protein